MRITDGSQFQGRPPHIGVQAARLRRKGRQPRVGSWQLALADWQNTALRLAHRVANRELFPFGHGECDDEVALPGSRSGCS